MNRLLCVIGLHRWSRWGTPFVRCNEHYDYIGARLEEVCQRWCQRCNRREDRTMRLYVGPCPVCHSKAAGVPGE